MGLLVPNVVKREANGERAYDLYSRLLADRIIFLDGEVTSESASIIVSELLYLESESNTKPIDFYINSPGGSCTAGFAIYDTMQYIKAPVRTICMGMAASMGAFLLVAGEKGMRMSMPNAEIMIHQPLIAGGGISGQCTDIKIHSDHMVFTRNRLESIMAERSGNTVDQMHAWCERDNYLTAQEALDMGLIDSIVEKK